MKYGFARGYAKLNLTLDVLSRRDDGYHDLEMIMQSVSLCDSIAVRIGTGEGITTISNVRHIPNDDRNIVVKASKAFCESTGVDCGGIHIAVEKRIPSSAGLAGGSADGAAVLRLLNELCNTGLSDEALCDIGIKVGSDIPFCLMGGTRIARAKGEAMSEISPMHDCYIVISKPWKGMSTKAVFTEIDSHPILKHPDTNAMVSAIEAGNIYGVCDNVYNVFEPVVSGEIADISTIKRLFRSHGALAAAMTGSGSAVFGIFDKEKSAKIACGELKKRYEETFLVRPIGGEEVRKCIWISQE